MIDAGLDIPDEPDRDSLGRMRAERRGGIDSMVGLLGLVGNVEACRILAE